ncbi:MAG: hypothetical protein JRJ12_15245 [Deltaproteobacteria bacterium]|nr:hypothetical protein [Deltaproteobacteria bacterium]MBW2072209.1 hypothetical protein [Deltaproteobacteria bacterium]
MPLSSLNPEEILYYCVAILAIVSFGSGFTRFFALSFAHPPPEDDVVLDFNPFTNLDIVGTIVLLLGGFGWGRQLDDSKVRFKKQKLGWLIISLITPFASLVLALTASYVKYFLWSDRVVDVLLNLSVAVTAYHIVPIPPLTGSRLIYLLLPSEKAWRVYTRTGPFLILALVLLDRFAGFGLLRQLVSPIVAGLGRFVAY